MFRSSLDTSIKPILCPSSKSGSSSFSDSFGTRVPSRRRLLMLWPPHTGDDRGMLARLAQELRFTMGSMDTARCACLIVRTPKARFESSTLATDPPRFIVVQQTGQRPLMIVVFSFLNSMVTVPGCGCRGARQPKQKTSSGLHVCRPRARRTISQVFSSSPGIRKGLQSVRHGRPCFIQERTVPTATPNSSAASGAV